MWLRLRSEVHTEGGRVCHKSRWSSLWLSRPHRWWGGQGGYWDKGLNFPWWNPFVPFTSRWLVPLHLHRSPQRVCPILGICYPNTSDSSSAPAGVQNKKDVNSTPYSSLDDKTVQQLLTRVPTSFQIQTLWKLHDKISVQLKNQNRCNHNLEIVLDNHFFKLWPFRYHEYH